MDPIGKYIFDCHVMLGHDKTAALLGQPPRDKATCVICIYQAHPTAENQQKIEEAIGRSATP
jgi:hypothetical protein